VSYKTAALHKGFSTDREPIAMVADRVTSCRRDPRALRVRAGRPTPLGARRPSPEGYGERGKMARSALCGAVG